MSRIQSQNSDQAHLARQVLAWVTRSSRELHAEELQTALAIKPGDQDLDTDDIPELEDMLLACAGLVTVVEESNIVRLVHYTTQEYFDRTWSRWFPNAENEMGVACVTYLLFGRLRSSIWMSYPYDESFTHNFDDVAYEVALENKRVTTTRHHGDPSYIESCANKIRPYQRFCSRIENTTLTHPSPPTHDDYERKSVFDKMLDDNPFYRYAAAQWVRHARDIKEPWPELQEILQCPEAFQGVFELLFGSGDGDVDPQRSAGLLEYFNFDQVTDTHLLAHVGLLNILEITHTHHWDVDAKDNRDMTPLMHAAYGGHLLMVVYLLEHGANQSLRDDRKFTALSFACRMGHLDVVDALLRKDDDTADSPNSYGVTPLMCAIRSGHLEIVERLLATGKVNANAKNSGITPLSLAVSYGELDICETLTDKGGADINLMAGQDIPKTVLGMAVRTNSLPVAKLLLEYDDIQVDLEDSQGQTALHTAASHGFNEMTRLLIEVGGADVTVRNGDGLTPLLFIFSSNWVNPSVIESLLAAQGIEPDARDPEGRSAFALAVFKKYKWTTNDELFQIMNRLAATPQVDINSQDMYGRTAPYHAVMAGRILLVEQLLQYKGIRPDIPDHEGRPPLEAFVCRKVITARRYSRRAEAGCNLFLDALRILSRQQTTITAIFLMGFETTTSRVFGLLEATESEFDTFMAGDGGAAPSFDDAEPFELYSWLPVKYRRERCVNMRKIARRLVELTGTDFDRRHKNLDDGKVVPAPDQDERSALVVACELGAHPDMVVGLLSLGAAINAQDDRGISPLSSAVIHGLEEVIPLLLAAGADSNIRDRLGRTALGCISRKTSPLTVKLLLEHGADIHTRDFQGMTPLMLAFSGEGSIEVLVMLLDMGARVKDRDEKGHVLWQATYLGAPVWWRIRMISILEKRFVKRCKMSGVLSLRRRGKYKRHQPRVSNTVARRREFAESGVQSNVDLGR